MPLPSTEPRDKSNMEQLPGNESEVHDQEPSEPHNEEKEEQKEEADEKSFLETRDPSENQQNPKKEIRRLVAPHDLSHGPDSPTKPHTPVKDEENILEDTLKSTGRSRQRPTEELQGQEYGGDLRCLAVAAPRLVVRCCSRALEEVAKYLHQPCDPASLAAVRIMFGALGMAAGWRWRASCTVYLLGYWYLVLLDKSTWNNHSYLYGLLTLLMLAAEPHACWSVDTRAAGGARHVPFWNYFMLRTQVFFLYFFAGVKKLDSDWLAGHSMRHLGEHWIFYPFRVFVSTDAVDYYIIHLGGFLLDFTLGPLLLWPPSRKLALFFGSSFHLMNSQIFYIGMFPWVCLATLPIFCRCDWPRTLLASLPKLPPLRAPWQRGAKGGVKADDETISKEEAEVKRGGAEMEQAKETRKMEEHEVLSTLKRNKNCSYPGVAGVTGKQKATTVVLACYLLTQIVLPFSHSLTKGFNTWTEGPYGYSWDMMVHSWDTLHVKVTAVTTTGGHRLYVDPNMWVSSPRWSSHADMAVQYCRCVQSRLAALGHPVTALHLDVWKSLNGRFQQRVFDPTVNILEAPWSPFSETPWVLPLVTELDHWRERLYRQQEGEEGSMSLTQKLFVADFPGLTLENYLSADLENVTLEVLKGEVVVLLPCESGVGDPSSALHVPRSGGTNGTTNRQQRKDMRTLAHQPRHTAQEPPVENFNFEKGRTESTDLYAEHHDLSASIHRARQSLQELVGSVHEGTTGLVELPTGTAKVDVCSVALQDGGSMVLPSGAFHSVTTTSSEPAVYAYTFINATLREEEEKRNQTPGSNAAGETHTAQQDSATYSSDTKDSKTSNKQDLVDGKDVYHPTSADFPTFEDLLKFIKRKLELFWRAGRLLLSACHCLLTRSCMKIE